MVGVGKIEYWCLGEIEIDHKFVRSKIEFGRKLLCVGLVLVVIWVEISIL